MTTWTSAMAAHARSLLDDLNEDAWNEWHALLDLALMEVERLRTFVDDQLPLLCNLCGNEINAGDDWSLSRDGMLCHAPGGCP